MPLPHRPRTVITGAASGLGRALALDLAARQARILVADIDDEGARETARLVAAAGGEAQVTRCDVRKSDDVAALLGEVDRAFGGVDLVVNNAGVAVNGVVGTVPLADWEWIVSINLWGVIYGCHTFVPRLKEQRSGHILNVASAAGFFGLPGLTPYNVTKAAVISLSESMHGDLARYGVGVTVLCPTFFKTRIAESARSHQKGSIDIVKRMDRATLQADGVARAALATVDAGHLYAVPHSDGRWAWRIKRTIPALFHETLLPRIMRHFGKTPARTP